MDQLTHYRQIIQDVLTELTVVPFAYGEIAIETVFDVSKDRYMVVNVGWDRTGRVYGPFAHVDIIDGKFWIQRDGTAEGLPVLLMEKGVPKDHIVVAYYPEGFRKHMEFAVS